MSLFALFFAGALLCNSIPHLCAGLQGVPFPSPFASPPGIGNSSPLVNVFWGLFNAWAALALVSHHPFQVGLNTESATFFAGALAAGAVCSIHFGKNRK